MSEYLKQAENFLTETDTTLTVTYLRTSKYFKEDKDVRDIYNFTLSNSKGSYSHEFGDSLRNTERKQFASTKQPLFSFKHESAKARKLGFNPANSEKFRAELIAARNYTPNAYDILAGLHMYVEPVFADFINEFGYNDSPIMDYPKLRDMHDDLLNQQKALERMFTTKQLELLSEIQ